MNLFLKLIWRTLVLLGFYQVVRFIFFAYNYDLYAELTTGQVLQSFVLGVRYDLSAIALLNGIYLLIIAWPNSKDLETTAAKYLIKMYFVIMNGFFIGFNIVDAEYYKFVGRRLTAGSFAISKDINEQAASLMAANWHLTICIFIVFPLLGWLYDTGPGALRSGQTPWPLRFGRFIAVLAAMTLAIRGGTQAHPLTVAHAYQGQAHAIAQLRLNSSLTIIKSLKKKPLEPLHYYKSWDVVRGILKSNTNQAKPIFSTKPNIVVIVLESFNLEYTGLMDGDKSYTPFLKELAQRGASFTNNLANGRRSIDALNSIFAGLPPLMKEALITSQYQSASFSGLPKILKDSGYQKTAFFHGGHNGTMFFDIQSSMLGFDTYYGSDEYPDQTQDDGNWGIFDEPYFAFAAHQMGTFTEPFMAGLFSLSSHNPYNLPPGIESKFPSGPLEIHKTIRYTDYALRKFFEKAQEMPWYKNTLFVITADHTSSAEKIGYKNMLGLYKIPLIFFHPSRNLDLDNNQISQQIDISPTIVDLIGIKTKQPRFGRSLRINKRPYALIYRYGANVLLTQDHALEIDRFGEEKYYKWKTDLDLRAPYEDKSEDAVLSAIKLRALVQYYRNGLLENKLDL